MTALSCLESRRWINMRWVDTCMQKKAKEPRRQSRRHCCARIVLLTSWRTDVLCGRARELFWVDAKIRRRMRRSSSIPPAYPSHSTGPAPEYQNARVSSVAHSLSLAVAPSHTHSLSHSLSPSRLAPSSPPPHPPARSGHPQACAPHPHSPWSPPNAHRILIGGTPGRRHNAAPARRPQVRNLRCCKSQSRRRRRYPWRGD